MTGRDAGQNQAPRAIPVRFTHSSSRVRLASAENANVPSGNIGRARD
jgi:hypothetical protein